MSGKPTTPFEDGVLCGGVNAVLLEGVMVDLVPCHAFLDFNHLVLGGEYASFSHVHILFC